MKNFEELLEQYEPMISAVIRKLHIYRDFEQFRQAGRVALWQATVRFDQTKGDFTPFAYRSIYGALLDELKRESRFNTTNVPVEDDIMESLCGSATDDLGEDSFSDLLSTLTAEESQLLSFLFIERLTQKECAAQFGITIPGVKKRRERLLLKLRERLTEKQLV